MPLIRTNSSHFIQTAPGKDYAETASTSTYALPYGINSQTVTRQADIGLGRSCRPTLPPKSINTDV